MPHDAGYFKVALACSRVRSCGTENTRNPKTSVSLWSCANLVLNFHLELRARNPQRPRIRGLPSESSLTIEYEVLAGQDIRETEDAEPRRFEGSKQITSESPLSLGTFPLLLECTKEGSKGGLREDGRSRGNSIPLYLSLRIRLESMGLERRKYTIASQDGQDGYRKLLGDLT
ncbi:hypothetical protein V1477_014373 [Vespula maculifrons]|uniref:Uncharacterized protein n=2 Tax=Vespula TaxID=7451 RepID=A0A834KRG6_VESVU|nr:hypothetical protein HZH66_000592 [Vespula vulgaris]